MGCKYPLYNLMSICYGSKYPLEISVSICYGSKYPFWLANTHSKFQWVFATVANTQKWKNGYLLLWQIPIDRSKHAHEFASPSLSPSLPLSLPLSQNNLE